jgi:pyridoxamine 5'-phosphate oxidase
MADRDGLFAGDDPFDIARRWLAEAEKTEPNDPNAIALATVDADGMPDPPRPPFWGGFRIAPTQIEFWADGAFRLHDRFRWDKEATGVWIVERLSP